MTAIFTGFGAGFERSSANILGGAGQVGTSLLGRGGESVSVNAATGNLLITHQDEFLIGRGPDIGISRTYNSLQDTADGDNGDNWQQSTTRRVYGLTGTLNAAGSTVTRLGADGSAIVYTWNAARSAYLSKDGDGAFDTLTSVSNVWTWRDGASQSTETYAAHGSNNWRITAATDTDGNALSFTYDGDKLLLVTTADGSWTQYVWTGNSIASVITGYTDLATSTSKTLTRVRYTYDGQGRLSTVTTDLTPDDNSVTDNNKYVTTYTYHGTSTRIASITQTDGSSLTITYDGSNRVQTLTQTVASGVTRVTTLTYGSNYTTITGSDNQVTRLDYDASKRLTKITAPPATSGATAQTVQFAYDADDNLDTVTDGNGKVTSYDYDTNGNNTLVTDATGRTIQRTYNSANRLITELAYGSNENSANAAHYAQYAYDSEGHLRFAVNASGQVTEYRYGSAGELLRTISYAEHTYSVGASTISEAGMTSWAAGLGSLVSVKVAENIYDARGNLAQSKAYGTANAAGNPLTSEGTTTSYFVHDQAGRLRERWREGENHETFLYDGMGRLISSTDKNGGTVSIVFDDANTKTLVTSTGSGLTTQTYNKAGELIATTTSSSYDIPSSSAYKYDSAGRLRVASTAFYQNPDLTVYQDVRNTYFYYDKAGRKVAEVNHLGELTEHRYDAAGRVAATIVYSTAITGTALTNMGNPAYTGDLSAMLPAPNAADIWSWTVYDDAGRVRQAIDNLGSTAVYEYDNSGRLVKTTAYYNKLSAGTLAGFKTTSPAAVTLPTADPAKDVVTRAFYNKAGQLVGALDGEGYLSETVYDSAGYAIKTIAYATATNPANRASGTFATLKSGLASPSADRMGYSVHDGQGLLRYSVNARGGITGYNYDGAGRLIQTTVYATELTLSDFTYDAVKAAVTANAADRTSWIVYDAAGRAAYTVDAEGGVTAFKYNTSGQVTKAVAYDNLYSSAVNLASLNSWAANATQANDSSNRVTRNYYGAQGTLRFTIDAENYVTYFNYDSQYRTIETRHYADALVATDATTIDTIANTVFPSSNFINTLYSYDGAGRVLTVTDGEGTVTRSTYNALGQLYEVTAAHGHADAVTTRYTYDGAGRVLTQTAGQGTADAATITYAYDGLGNRTSVTDARGNATTFTYDKLGQALTATNALSGVTTYVYDAFGNVVKATDPGTASTFRYYDNLNRLTLSVDGEKYVTTIAYNRFGEIASTSTYKTPLASAPAIGTPPSTSGLGAAIVLASVIYDRLGRVVLKVDAEGYVDASAYNAFGQLVSFKRYPNTSFGAPAGGATPAQITAAFNNATSLQTTATNAQNSANTAAANAATAAAAVAPLVAAANTAQANATTALKASIVSAAAAASAQATATAAQAAADAALAYAISLEGGNYAEIQAAYAAATQAQNEANAAQAAANTAAAASTAAAAAAATAQADYVAAQNAANTAAATAASAQAAYTTAQNAANTAAATAASAQTTANNLATQLSQNAVHQAYSAPVTTLQAYYNSLAAQVSALQTALQQAYAGIYGYPPEQQQYYYMAYIMPLEGQLQALGQLMGTLNSYITWLQQGNALDATGKGYINSYLGFTTQQVNDYNTLAANAASAATTAANAQAAATTAQNQANTAQTTANNAAAAATAAQNTANTKQAQAATAQTAATNAAAAATAAQNTANTEQTQANDALAYAQWLEANSPPQGTPAEIAAAHAAAQSLQATATAAQNAANTAAANAAPALAAANTAQAQANTALAAVTTAQNAANAAASTAVQAQLDADRAQDAADVALAQAQRLQAGPVAGFDITAIGTASETLFEYDRRGLLKKSTDAEGWFESYTYDAFGRRTTTIAKSSTTAKVAGGTTTYAYDKRGWLLSETLPIQAYDSAGNTTGAIKTSYVYDVRGNVLQKIEWEGTAAKRTTTYTYDKLNRLKTTAGEAISNGVTINASTKAVSNQSSASPTETITYDANGNVIRTVDAAGLITVFFYDALNRKTAEVVRSDPAGNLGVLTTYQYDANGNVTNIKVYETKVAITAAANGGTAAQAPGAPGTGDKRETSFTYDALGRMVTSQVLGATTGSWNGTSWTSSTNPLETIYQYDYLGNVVKVTDPNTNATFSYYDRLGRKTAQVDAEGYLTAWTYNSEGNVLSERRYATQFTGTPTTANPPSVSTNGADRVTNFTYDKNGNRLSEARTGVVVHNGSGGTSTVTATISYLYNGLAQVTRKTEATTEQFNYTYDAGGRLTQETRPTFASNTGANVTPTLNYFYDGLGNLTRTVQAAGGDAVARVTTYTYGTGGRLSSMTDAEGGVRNYLYDVAGRLVLEHYTRAVTSTGGSTTNVNEGIGYRYDATGRSIGQAFYTKPASTWNFASTNDWTSIEYTSFGDVKRSGINGIWQQENKYDVAGRLWATNSGDGVWKYFGYDRNGNQTVSITSAGSNTSGKTFAQALAMIGNSNTNGTYTVYDKRNMATSVVEEGRQLSDSSTLTLTTTRSYNAFGDIASETDATGATVSYTYNTMGRMIRSESPTVQIMLEDGTTRWVKPSEDYYYDKSGRLVASRDANGTYGAGGTSGNGAAKSANTGNLTRLTLLAGTGYSGSQALVTHETHADGGIRQTKFDIHGDARVVIDEENRTLATNTYDKLGRLITAARAGGLTDNYTYDILGRQVSHWNSLYTSSNKEFTTYDIQGRVTSNRAFGGDITDVAYSWDGTLEAVGTGLTDIGGWIQTTTHRNTLNSGVLVATEKSDVFGRVITRTDLDGRLHNFDYNLAGWMTRTHNTIAGSAEINYSYYNTGQIRGQIGNAPETLYKYDAAGRRTFESVKSYNWQNGQFEFLKQATVIYDGLGRMSQYEDLGGPDMPYAKMVYSYDANGNVMAVQSTRSPIDQYGNPGSGVTDTKYSRYDNMNRMVIVDGQLSGSQIVRGTGGKEITFDKTGQRTSLMVTNVTYQDKYGPYYTDVQELYVYDSAGRLQSRSESVAGAAAQLRSTYTYDAMGRQLTQKDYVAGSTTNTIFDKSVTYNDKGQVSFERTYTLVGSDTMRADATYTYLDYDGNYALGQVGQVSTINYKNNNNSQAPDTLLQYRYDMYEKATLSQQIYKPNTSQGTTYYNNYQIDSWGYTRQVDITDGRSRTVIIKHDEHNQILSREEDEINYARGNPRQIYYRFNGRQLGEVSNDGTTNINYGASLTQRSTALPASPGPFQNGSTAPTAHTDFNQHYDAINSYQQSSSPRSSYTVQGGESLQSIAAQVWGDASLWYKIADANGIGAGRELAPGQTLVIPGNVVRSHNNANTFKAYDPGKVLGDISPTAPEPAPAASSKKKGCGVLGMILLAAVAIAVVAIAGPAIIGAASIGTAGQAGFVAATGLTGLFGGATVAAGSFAAVAAGVVGGAVAGALGSIVSQGVGVAAGIQDKFSWKAVGLAAIGGGVGGGLSSGGLFGNTAGGAFTKGAIGIKSGIVDAAVRGVAQSTISQGIGVATGLQDKFSWAGVAAAAVGAAAGHAVNKGLGLHSFDETRSLDNLVGHTLVGTSRAIANAATRSVIEGTNFGDNVLRALPDAIGETVGGLIASAFRGPSELQRFERALRRTTSDEAAIDRAKSEYLQFSQIHRRAIATQGGGLDEEESKSAIRSFAATVDRIDRDFQAGFFDREVLVEIFDILNIDLLTVYKQVHPWSEEDRQYWRDFKEVVGFELAAIDVYSETSDPTMLLAGYERLSADAVRAIGFDPDRLVENKIGYAAAMYRTPAGYYIYANRGTDNWVNYWADNGTEIGVNLHSYFIGGRNAQYDFAEQNAVMLSRIEGIEVRYTGHSLGGGLAITQAIATGSQAVVFNHAPYHRVTYDAYAGPNAGNAVIRSYRNSIDILRAPDIAQRVDDVTTLGGPAFNIFWNTEILDARQWFWSQTSDQNGPQWNFTTPEGAFGMDLLRSDHSMTGLTASHYASMYDRLRLESWYDPNRK